MIDLNLPMDQIGLFIFVLVRVGAIVFAIPFLGSRNVPVLVKSSLAMAVAVMVVPQLKISAPILSEDPFRLAIGIAGEAAMGLIIGVMLQLLISGVQLAGEMAGFQMGIALANVMDPTSSQQIPILSQFLNLFAMLMFLVLNMHHYFLKVLGESFHLIPPFSIQLDQALLPLVIQNAGHMFVVAIQLGAPVMVGLLLSSVALALTARTVPQVQIFVVAMPLKVLLGLSFMAVSLPFCATYLFKIFREFGGMLISLLNFFQ